MLPSPHGVPTAPVRVASTTATASSTTAWARSRSRATPCGGRRPSARSRTSRSAAPRWSPARPGAGAGSRRAAARVNAELGVLDRRAGRRRSGRPPRRSSTASTTTQFPIDVFQTGSGTSSNMNMNEVLATLAARAGVEVHPNDHVNASQSSNDTFPTVDPRRRDARGRASDLLPALDHLATAPGGARPRSSPTLVKSGRTHLMDATPVMLGQEFGGYAATVRLGVERLESALPRVARAAAGRYGGRHRHQHPARASPRGSSPSSPRPTGQPFTEARNHFEAQGDPRRARRALRRAAHRSRSASPRSATTCAGCPRARRTGLAEIHLPDLQPGSSIMPGKVNPVLPEATLMVCAQVIGNDAAVDGRRRQRQLRAQRDDAGDGPQPARVDPPARPPRTALLADRCVDGITANAERMRQLRRVLAVGGHPAEPATSATRTPPRSPSRRWPRRRPSARP